MENASKALLMAGGVLISIILLGALTIMWNQLSSIGNANLDATRVEQIAVFNQEYLSYDKKTIRGSELLTLINKILDYNTLKADVEEIAYQKMEMKINLKSNNAFGGRIFTNSTYTQDNIGGVINEPRSYEQQTSLSTMSALSSYVNALPNSDDPSEEDTEGLKELLKKLTGDENKYSIDKILNYAEYSEFKRAKFKCTKVEYNTNTGRIILMEFEQK